MIKSTRRQQLGASIAAVLLFVLCLPGRASAEHGDCRRLVRVAALMGAGVGAGIGLVGDAIIQGKETVYLAPGEPASRTVARSFQVLQSTVRAGDMVWVTTTQAHQEVKGRVAGLSDTTLALVIDGQPHVMPETVVRKIRRRHNDSLRNGPLVGALIGLIPLLGMAKCG